MKQQTVMFFLLAMLVAFPAFGHGEEETAPEISKEDRAGITQTALDYIEGWYEGDAERMEGCLHPELAKRILMPGARGRGAKLDNQGAMTLVQSTRKGFGKRTPKEKQQKDIEILDVFGNAASVRLTASDWVDYMHMSKIDGKWVISNVLWEFKPEAKERMGIPQDL